jgi:RNA-directed DNA polymerase
VSRQSLARAKRRLRQLTDRRQGGWWEWIRDDLRHYIVGWVNYYGIIDSGWVMQRLDQWVRRRLRQLSWVRWKTTGRRYRQLRKFGVSDQWARRTAGSSKGAWHLSKSQPLHVALSNARWHQWGLTSFTEQYQRRQT